MRKKWRAKLHSKLGETISEVLIALLISTFALTMLATMISSTVSMVMKSKESMKNYYEESIKLEQQGTAESSAEIRITGDNVSVTENVNLYKNDFFSSADKKVYAYTKAD